MSNSPDATLVLTTSFPRFPGDLSGHFVASEVKAMMAGGTPVRVLAGGRANTRCTAGIHATELGAQLGSSADGCTSKVDWLGGSAVFQSPGALARLRERPLRALSLLPALFNAHRALVRAKERRVIVHWLVPFGLSAVIADARRGGDLELVLVAHGSDVRLLGRLPGVFLRLALDHLARRGATIRFVSSELRAELLNVAALPAATRAWLEQSPVEPAAFDLPQLPARADLRRRLKVDSDTHLLVVVGRLVPTKRVHVAVAAALLVPGGRVVVLGAGPEAERLTRRFPEAEFLGELPRHEALAWLSAADVVVSASRTEGAPTVVREARALGTPVVCPAVGDTRAWAKRDAELWLLDL